MATQLTSVEQLTTPKQLGAHAFHINLYSSTCMNTLSRFYFLTPMSYIDHGPKGKIDRFKGKQKRGKISETG